MSTAQSKKSKSTAAHRSKPLYCQVKEQLLHRLADEFWRPGQMLPSEIQLAKEFKVSHGTMRRAIDDLARQGLLSRHQGRGTAVPTHNSQRSLFHFFRLVDIDDSKQIAESKALTIGAGASRQNEADKLKLERGEDVIRICRLRFLEARPKIIERIVLPLKLFGGIEKTPLETLPNTIYEHYERKYNVTVLNAIEKLAAVSARPTEARNLRIPVGTPLLEIVRVAYTHREQPIELRISRVLTDQHRYVSWLD